MTQSITPWTPEVKQHPEALQCPNFAMQLFHGSHWELNPFWFNIDKPVLYGNVSDITEVILKNNNNLYFI